MKSLWRGVLHPLQRNNADWTTERYNKPHRSPGSRTTPWMIARFAYRKGSSILIELRVYIYFDFPPAFGLVSMLSEPITDK
jgi:hypothetical protein